MDKVEKVYLLPVIRQVNDSKEERLTYPSVRAFPLQILMYKKYHVDRNYTHNLNEYFVSPVQQYPWHCLEQGSSSLALTVSLMHQDDQEIMRQTRTSSLDYSKLLH